MNNPQIWTVIASFSAVMFAAFGLFFRAMRSEFASLRTEMGLRFDAADAKIDGVEARLDAKIDGVEARLNAKIDGVEARLDAKIDNLAHVTELRFNSLEADMHLIKGHLLGQPAA